MRHRGPLVVVLLAACGGGAAVPASPAAKPAPSASASAVADTPARPGHVWRRDVVAVLSKGLPAFLQAFPVTAVATDGKFRGWRLDAEPEPAYRGAGLQVGDVVVSVNGGPIERPEQALKAWQSLAIAPELRIAFERAGERRETVFPIDD
jgi:type II secretory pathway component PulC